MTMQGEDPWASQYPENILFDEDIKNMIYRYYTEVDTQGHHDGYARCFTEDTLLILPDGSPVHGRDGIRSLHLNMWDNIERRLHKPSKVFPFGDRATEYVVVGTVEWWAKDGNYSKLNMAGHFQVRRDENSQAVEISSARIWLH